MLQGYAVPWVPGEHIPSSGPLARNALTFVYMSRNALMFLMAFGLLFTSCKREERGGVPITPIDISINVNNPAYADLAVPGGWLYLTGGSMGILVVRSTPETFVAFDRHCPYRTADLCRVSVDESELIARDTTCCGSAFLILDGSVAEGPAALNLQRYNTSFNGTTLRIFN
jgi:nitrite reductase/ring-hydroxylating ferredoxin subunit